MKHQDLDVWKKSIDITTLIYKTTENFPQHEQFGLVSQMRRCAVSIPSNIAEGCARFSDKDTIKFLSISLGAIAELQTQLIIAKNLQYANNSDDIIEELEVIKRMILNLSKYLKNKENPL